MTPLIRAKIVEEFRAATRGLPVRWADEGHAGGDFEGRETTLEIFDVQEDDQQALFRALAPQRNLAKELLGERLRVLFHTPEATSRHYAAVRGPAPVRLRLVPAAPRTNRTGEVVDDDVAGESRPARSRVG